MLACKVCISMVFNFFFVFCNGSVIKYKKIVYVSCGLQCSAICFIDFFQTRIFIRTRTLVNSKTKLLKFMLMSITFFRLYLWYIRRYYDMYVDIKSYSFHCINSFNLHNSLVVLILSSSLRHLRWHSRRKTILILKTADQPQSVIWTFNFN